MILVLGAGLVGRAIATDLSADCDVVVCDVSSKSLRSLDGVRKYRGNVFDNRALIERSEAVVSALPGSISCGIVRKLLRMGKHVVDTGFMAEDPMSMEGIARRQGCIYVPDAGYAPGLSNVLAGHLYRTMSPVSIEILVAGLPSEDIAPFHHAPTFNVEGLIDEYTRPARIIRNGNIVQIDPLSEIRSISFPGFGRLEAFYTDGLRTLLKTINVRNMYELTLRYPGHLASMRFLRDMGFFSDSAAGGIVPRAVTETLFSSAGSDFRDLCLTKVAAVKDDITVEFTSIDRFDEKTGTKSMARMTGYTAAVIARLLLDGYIEGRGVLPPEYLGFDDRLFSVLFSALRKRGIVFRSRRRKTGSRRPPHLQS
ncbi:MAG: saccharopine dehydrogenase C-terminal domain-containing protein [Methanomassiliicoccales archaeon]|nr:saccharopine dehydrogenase C-terminal domain-containing protein [Methanomassiliicoccales archaeon]